MTQPLRYYLNLGTNLGDRRLNLRRAIACLSGGTGGCMVSRVIESQPWGFQSGHPFLNVGVCLLSPLPPQLMLRRCQATERRLGSGSHRDSEGRYADRLIDIDIMAIEQWQHGRWQPLTLRTPALTVPHPHLMERDFFLTPLRQLQQGGTFFASSHHNNQSGDE